MYIRYTLKLSDTAQITTQEKWGEKHLDIRCVIKTFLF